ncbi:uncharacterized protein LOC124910715 [Impatiens glandulifera]|uniref:uncharacterized protein LOC124910715 n=1 Tax=Impatiens glandulifera TaxID=253017 RepID=UPI001FB0AB6D|nr:uncharacterized protein LOC124910715 [Impatiens glandulifera]
MDEDFSFPTTTDAPPRFIGSPTLWRRSSSVAPIRSSETTNPFSDFDQTKLEQEKTPNSSQSRRKSFSYVEENRELHSFDGEEIKMDVLWEDFMNEEVSKSCGFLMEADEINTVEYGRKQRSLKLTKGVTGGKVVVSGKRAAGLLLFLRVMKKFVLFHNSQRSIKK